MNYTLRRPRCGFTLIELLVVIGIIAVLIGITLPAIMKVREASNRTTCRSNLRQIALATHAYHGLRGVLPVNSQPGPFGPYGPSTHAWSWLARILPFIEANNLYRQANIPRNTLYQSRDVVAAQIPLFLCPSDPSSATGPRDDAADLGMWNPPFIVAGQTNYKGVSGANWAWGDPRWRNPGTNGSWDGLNHGDGLFYRYDWKQPKRLTDITDGTSNTLMVGEDVPALNKWCSWAYANNAVGTCAIGPNATLPDGTPTDPWTWEYVYSFRSRHAGGLQFACADGSVHFITNDIDLDVYHALATIQGKEVISLPW